MGRAPRGEGCRDVGFWPARWHAIAARSLRGRGGCSAAGRVGDGPFERLHGQVRRRGAPGRPP
jgi:hypothetical protein